MPKSSIPGSLENPGDLSPCDTMTTTSWHPGGTADLGPHPSPPPPTPPHLQNFNGCPKNWVQCPFSKAFHRLIDIRWVFHSPLVPKRRWCLRKGKEKEKRLGANAHITGPWRILYKYRTLTDCATGAPLKNSELGLGEWKSERWISTCQNACQLAICGRR